MKKFFALSAFCLLMTSGFTASATSPLAGVGLKFFHNYNPVDGTYSGISYSYLAAPLSGEIFLEMSAAVCFFGQAEVVENVIQKMIGIYNRRSPHPLALNYFTTVVDRNNRVIHLQFGISQRTNAGRAAYDWPRVRRCG